MSEAWRNQYDAWATGGRYSRTPVDATCDECGYVFAAIEHREFGTVWLEPEECPRCGSDHLATEDAEPPESDPYEDRL